MLTRVPPSSQEDLLICCKLQAVAMVASSDLSQEIFVIDMLTALKFISSAPPPQEDKRRVSHPKRCVAQKKFFQILIIIVPWINCAALHKTFGKFWNCNYLTKSFASLFTISAQVIFTAQSLDRNFRYLPVDASRKRKAHDI